MHMHAPHVEKKKHHPRKPHHPGKPGKGGKGSTPGNPVPGGVVSVSSHHHHHHHPRHESQKKKRQAARRRHRRGLALAPGAWDGCAAAALAAGLTLPLPDVRRCWELAGGEPAGGIDLASLLAELAAARLIGGYEPAESNNETLFQESGVLLGLWLPAHRQGHAVLTVPPGWAPGVSLTRHPAANAAAPVPSATPGPPGPQDRPQGRVAWCSWGTAIDPARLPGAVVEEAWRLW